MVRLVPSAFGLSGQEEATDGPMDEAPAGEAHTAKMIATKTIGAAKIQSLNGVFLIAVDLCHRLSHGKIGIAANSHGSSRQHPANGNARGGRTAAHQAASHADAGPALSQRIAL
jgi:hypothetical protein